MTYHVWFVSPPPPQGPFVMDVSKCPVAGNWSAWSAWSECVNNQRTKERRCDSPEPKYGGQDCVGAKIIYEKCDKQEKPIGQFLIGNYLLQLTSSEAF